MPEFISLTSIKTVSSVKSVPKYISEIVPTLYIKIAKEISMYDDEYEKIK
jgi:hypothetical protein